MTPDEIVRALREMLPPKVDYAELVCAEGFAHGQCYVWDDPEPYIISAAADLIESLQAEVDESQRGEQAAVEDIMCRDHCDVCVSGKEHGGECKKADYNCLSCKSETCMCRDCRDEDHWQWRGPQEAGEGETNGNHAR